VDYYSNRESWRKEHEEALTFEIPSMGRRVLRGFSLSFPWIGSLVVLFMFGVSLWLVWGLPGSTTTALITGVFLGLLASEGPLQVFQRLFMFYSEQGDIPEMRRVLKRSYLFAAAVGAGVAVLVLWVAVFAGIPMDLAELTAVAAVVMLVHRTSYIVVYSLKKFAQLAASYALGLTVLVSIFFLFDDLIPHTFPRYTTSLGAAIIVLTMVPVYYTYKVFTANSFASLEDPKRNRLNPIVANSKTIASRFRIQFWENLPYFLFGTLFFAMLFGDRVLSWLFNPDHVVNGITLPWVFNPVYHVGADLALIIIFPAGVVQYVFMSTISEQISNMLIRMRIAESQVVVTFLRNRYGLLLLVSLLTSGVTAFVLLQLAPWLMAQVGGGPVSLNILETAAVSNVFISIFMANAFYLSFMNKGTALAAMTLVGVLILGGGGLLLGSYFGFRFIVGAYLMAAMAATTLSMLKVASVLRNPGSQFFAKYL
jgi:hypothetical protein